MADTKEKIAALEPLATIDIPSTRIGLANSALAYGVPVFPYPTRNVPGTGYVAASQDQTIIDFNPTILLTRYGVKLSVNYAFGLCGPAYTYAVTAQGSVEDVSDPEKGRGQKLTLNLSDPDASAGFLVGDKAALGIHLKLELLHTELVGDIWHKHFETRWETKASLDKTFYLSLYTLLLSIINKYVTEIPAVRVPDSQLSGFIEQALGDVDAGNPSWIIMVSDRSSMPDLNNNGHATLEPTMAFALNSLAAITGFEEISAQLNRIGCVLAIGPSIEFGLRVDTIANSAYVGCQSFGEDFRIANSTLTATRYGTPTNATSPVSIGLRHTAEFDFRVGLAFRFSWLKFLNLSRMQTFSVTDVLGLDTSIGPYQHSVSSQHAVDACGNTSQVEVIFEEPG